MVPQTHRSEFQWGVRYPGESGVCPMTDEHEADFEVSGFGGVKLRRAVGEWEPVDA